MISQDQNIELLTTNALDFPFFVLHKAIKFYGDNNEPLILHKTTSGTEIIAYDRFMKGRHIINHKYYPIRRYFDPYVIRREDKEPFNWMSNNCEDFSSLIIEHVSGVNMRPHSPQRTFWIAILAIILIAMILIKK